MNRRKIKTLRCGQLNCKSCPLCRYMCQSFIKDRHASIGHIIEEMYKANKLNETEYKNAKKQAENYCQ